MSRLKKKLSQTDLNLSDLYNDSIEDKILSREEEQRKKAQHMAAIFAGVLTLVLVVGVIAMSITGKEKSGGGKLVESLETTTPEITTKLVTNELLNEKYPEISELIQLYYKARLTGDSASLEKYIDNIEEVNMEQIKAQNQYIKKYTNIECYTKMGLYDNTYVVFAYYEIKFKNIDTTAPGIDVLYVIRDEETGLVYLHNGATANVDIQNYVEALKNDEDVKALFEETNKALNDALESDSNLKLFYDSLVNAAKSDDSGDKNSDQEESTKKNSKKNSNK